MYPLSHPAIAQIRNEARQAVAAMTLHSMRNDVVAVQTVAARYMGRMLSEYQIIPIQAMGVALSVSMRNTVDALGPYAEETMQAEAYAAESSGLEE